MRIQRGVRSIATVGVTAAVTLALVAGPARADVTFHITPHSGPPGTIVRIHGNGLAASDRCCLICYWVAFSNSTVSRDWPVSPDDTGAFHRSVRISRDASPGQSSLSLFVTQIQPKTGSCISDTLATRHFLVT